MKEVNLFVSTFEQGKGLLPWDKVVDLSDSALLPGFSETQKRQLLSKPWNGYDDFNPNRILTATWKKDTGKWYGHDGITPLDQPLNDPANTSTNFTLPRSLTAGQNYNFAVEAVSKSGAVTKDLGQFKTLLPVSNSPFSSVSVLTHGFTLLPVQSGIPDSFFQMTNKIATVSGNTPENSGLIMRYDKPTGNWIPIDLQGRVITELTDGLNTSETAYLSTLANKLKKGVVIDGKEIKYLNNNKPLVLLNEWSLDRESVIPDVGFSEGAADALFASMVQLDLALGGKVGEYENNQLKRLYDSQGNLIRTQGDLFNSPLHFMGFSRGTVVNSEIVQRLGTFFPQAGGKSMASRDLQMTTIDPHDFYQPSLKLNLLEFIETNFSDFYEPKVQVWNNVTFADNYYQTVADPNGGTATPNGRALGLLPQEELDKNPKPAGLNFPKASGVTLGKADREILLGTREEEPDRINSRIGFTKDDVIAGTHKRAFGWYAGTVDLDLEEVLLQYPHVEASEKPQAVNDMLGKMGLPEMFDPNFPAAKPWYDNGNGEGVGEGWFYSVLGGGKEQRQYSPTGRVPVSFDNTLEAGMRGDYAVPTLFNGNFDQYIPNKSAAENLGRNAISQEIPGWSFHNSATSKLADPTKHLVNWSTIDSLKQRSLRHNNEIPGTSYLERMGIDSNDPNFSNYALELKGGDSMTHNRFVVPDWGSLRFNIHVPKEAANGHGKLKVTLKDVASGEEITEIILLDEANFLTGTSDSFYNNDLEKDAARKLGYATRGFETFNVFDTFYQGSTQQKELDKFRGKTATLKFELEGSDAVYLDDVFFKSSSLKFGEPTPKNGSSPARYSGAAYDGNLYKDNLLLEKPQYTLSYNGTGNIPNWASFQINKSSIYLTGEQNPSKRGFTNDRSLPPDFYQVTNADYKNRAPYVGGHQTPLASRSITLKDSKAVNLLTNIVPQQTKHNSVSFWEKFENYGQDFALNGKEVYVINGIDGIKDNLDAGGKDIQIPANIWKVMVVLDKPGADPSATPVYAVGFYYPNQDPRNIAEGWRNKDWSKIDDLTQRPVWSLEEIETKIGYDLFPLLPQEIKQDIKDIKYIFPSKESIGDTWASLPWKSNPPPLPEDPTEPEEELEELEGESEELEEE
ncbi:MAG: DNA/RNA non-specific endonuclease [Microcoleus sp.]